MLKSKLALIIDNGKITNWQKAALEHLSLTCPLMVFNCVNTRLRRNLKRHLFYYILNILSIRNRESRKTSILATSLPIGEVIDFRSQYKGSWQHLPDTVVDKLRAGDVSAVVKFGMNLLHVTDDLPPILSFHHGDPDIYRGRPAGFYELLNGEKTVGQVVQIICNDLDGGEVLAFAETKVLDYSYRGTLVEAYRHSALLLGTALRNLSARGPAKKVALGKIYKLPSNGTVLRIVIKLIARSLRRVLYGMFVEKRWQVSLAPASDAIKTLHSPFPKASSWQHLPQLPQYNFYADPFFCEGGILVEALNRRTGKGEIVMVDDQTHSLTDSSFHYSYPGSVTEDGETYIVPEIATWSTPRIYRRRAGRLEEVARLRIEHAVLDPTFLRHDGFLYLFGNRADVGSNALYLWVANSLFCEFRSHPCNPVRISPRGARMAGEIMRLGTDLIRVGQNQLDGYGDGVFAFSIDRISPNDYMERSLGSLRFQAVRGPHTLNCKGSQFLFDWYREKVSPLAGARRLRGRYF